MNELRVIEVTPDQFKALVREAVASAAQPLREEVERLRERLHKLRPVITHREAAFDFLDVKPSQVIRYIKGQQLPEDRPPLPAQRGGKTYYIRLETLYRWQMGETTEADLYDWQRE